MTTTVSIPLFPLHAVLFPGGSLPLRIFEPRYLDLVSQCLKSGSGFGVCLIREGNEVGPAAETYDVGTLSEISYFHRQDDGLLGITAFGVQRFRIVSREIQSNQLAIAQVELLPNEGQQPIPAELGQAADVLRDLFAKLDYPFIKEPLNYDDAGWVSSRLVELLPIRLEQKQLFLQMSDPILRLERICDLLQHWNIG